MCSWLSVRFMSGFPSVPTTSFTLEHDRTFDGSEVSTAVAEVPGATTINLRIAEHFMLISELPGVDRDLTLLAHPTEGVQYLEDVEPRIEKPETWYSQWSADFYGVIEELDSSPVHYDGSFYVLDVGVGSIYLHPSLQDYVPDSNPNLQEGVSLYVPASFLEVWEVIP